jgi:hypothetical protein
VVATEIGKLRMRVIERSFQDGIRFLANDPGRRFC